MVHVGDLLRGQLAAGGNLLFILLSHKEEAFHLRVAAEQLQAQRPGGAQQQPCRRDNGDPDIFGALHLDQHHGAKHQRHGGQHLVRDPEQRPQALHAAQRVDHALIQQVAPQPDAAGGTDNPGDQRVGFFQERHEVTQQILQHKAACAGTRIQRGEDKQRFKQDTEVVPEAHIRHRDDFMEYVGDTDGQRRRTASAVQYRRFADIFRRLQDLLR